MCDRDAFYDIAYGYWYVRPGSRYGTLEAVVHKRFGDTWLEI